MNHRIEQLGVVTKIYFEGVSAGWEQWLWLSSDHHFDSIFCHRELMKKHFDEMKRRQAMGFIVGDFFDAMQGKFDPRRNMDELRPEYRRSDYYDYVVDDAADWLRPYREHLVLLAPGNHETAVLKNANTYLSDRLTRKLHDFGSLVVHGGYGGWVKFLLCINKTRRMSINLKYFHGSGGEAPVTRGVIQTNRQAVYLPDANIVVNGHSHNAYYVPIARERLGDKGAQYFDIQHHVRLPGYKQSYGDGSAGWDIERGAVPKPLGGCWVLLRFEHDGCGLKIVCTPELESPMPVPSLPKPFTGKVYAQDGEYP